MNTLKSRMKNFTITVGVSLLLSLSQTNAQASVLALPDFPLRLTNTVEPNLLLTFDDSGSMAFSFLPDNIGYNQDGSDTTSAADRADRNASCSSDWNKLYYNPNTIYKPAVNSSGDPLNAVAETSFASAYTDGHHRTTGFTANSGITMPVTVNLGTQYRVSWNHFGFAGTYGPEFAPCGTGNDTGQAAFYFRYNVGTGCPASPTTAPPDSCFTRVNIAGASEEQNFANWYSYYRTRDLTAKSAAGRGFARLGNNVRVSGQHINNTTAGAGRFTTTVGTMQRFCNDPSNTDPLCANGSTNRTDFFTRLYNSVPTTGGTPLRTAMQRAGDHFGSGNTGSASPYRDVPGGGTTSNPERSCRKNFHLLFTDGYWNGGDGGMTDNVDGTAHTLSTLPTNTAYAAVTRPYSDAWSGTLADNAFNYWYRDLRTDLANDVPERYTVTTTNSTADFWNPKNDPANWQHVVTFTIGMGITGTLNPANYFNTKLANSAGDWDELLSGALEWPDPTDAENGDRVDDLWHAAVNSRGQYFSAGNPDQVVDAFNAIADQVTNEGGSGAGLGASGSSTSGSNYVYQVRYHPNKWTGRLLAFAVNSDGTVATTKTWEAGSDGLNTQNYLSTGTNGRNIFTYVPGTGGKPFLWANLDAAQKTALNTNSSGTPDGYGEARLKYLRGASNNEGSGNPVNSGDGTGGASLNFRERACLDSATVTSVNPIALATCPANVGKLGDIVNSAAVYVGNPPFGYPDTLDGAAAPPPATGGTRYSDFVSAQSASRAKMVYVGANDGMLHGFADADGKEKMAYVPNLVYANDAANNLSLFTSPTYSHRFYVDGTPTVGDVFYGGSWHTILVGGLRKGGRGYYALDITNPGTFTENDANATSLVKWEFTHANLGYSYSQPTIMKVSNSAGTTGSPSGTKGVWATIFGNGYNSTGPTGTASLFVVNIDTGVLIREIDTGVGDTTTPNGLATPTVVDIDSDHVADYVYAGDLRGNMWRFDIRNQDPATWTVSSIFSATDSTNAAAQPITSRPAVGFHPDGFGGLMVYFGTGKYLESTDNATTTTDQIQTFYGIYDRGVTARKTAPSVAVTVARSALLQQTLSTGTSPSAAFDVRTVTDNPIAWRLTRTAAAGTYLGWYVDLITTGGARGERQVTDPLLREGRIIFSTLIPSNDPCTPGGSGWLMELNAANGGQLKDTFDLNGNGAFTSADRVGGTTAAAGIASSDATEGSALSTPIVLANPSSQRPQTTCKETKLAVSTLGKIVRVAESCEPYDVREGWRQRK